MKYYDSDIVVVGAGIMGAFTAFRLAQRNRTVFLLDKGEIGRESTGRCGGGIRQQYRDPAELPLAMKAIDIWAGLEKELCEPLEYRRLGSLKLLHNDDELEEAQARVSIERESGLDVVLLTPEEVVDYAPPIGSETDLTGGTLCMTDGTANPLLFARALGLGLAETIPGRSPILDGFGLIAFASLFPIIAVMGYAQIGEWKAKRVKRRET